MKREINITDQDIRCCDGLDISGDAVNATYELWFDVDKYFGTDIRDTEAWINFYTFWHKDGTITAEYVIDDTDKSKSYDWPLTEEEKGFFKGMMREYCLRSCNCPIEDLLKEI